MPEGESDENPGPPAGGYARFSKLRGICESVALFFEGTGGAASEEGRCRGRKAYKSDGAEIVFSAAL